MMDDYNIGYRNPPKGSRYKPGTTGNPNGRPKRQSVPLAELIDHVLDGKVTYRHKGRSKSVSREELTLKVLIDSAVGGDVAAAELVLKMRAHAQRYGAASAGRVEIHNWLPEQPGQTADQKAHELSEAGPSTDPIEWWNAQAPPAQPNIQHPG
jgi:hypothetical protein